MNGEYGHKFFEHPHAFANQGLITVAPDSFVDESMNRKGQALSLYFQDSSSNWYECPFYSGTGEDLRLDSCNFIVTELNDDGKTERVVEWPSEVKDFARLKKENVPQENLPSAMRKTEKSLAPDNGPEIEKNNGEKKSSDELTIGHTVKIGGTVLLVGSAPWILELLSSADNDEDLI